jgi:ABC-type multidrug transport system ATPase subunit
MINAASTKSRSRGRARASRRQLQRRAAASPRDRPGARLRAAGAVPREPTVGLDTRIRCELLDLIGGLRNRTGMTTVLTTHYLDEAEPLCDRIAIVHEGRIVALDKPRALLDRLGKEIVELRVERDPDGALAAMRTRGIVGGDAFAVGATLTLPITWHSARDTIAAITDLGIEMDALATRKPTLDDVYLQLTGNRLAG